MEVAGTVVPIFAGLLVMQPHFGKVEAAGANPVDLKILKSGVAATAKFYPWKR